MTSFASAIDRDANRQVIPTYEAFKLESTWTFVAGTTGATGAHTLFTVTGNVVANVFAICDTDLAVGGATTAEVGVAGNTALLLGQITASTFDDGDVWTVDGGVKVGGSDIFTTFALNDGADIILTIGTSTLTGGVVDFYCLWRPLSTGANITATTPA